MHEDWRIANVMPVFKKSGKKDPGSYRPVSLTWIPGKARMCCHLEGPQQAGEMS